MTLNAVVHARHGEEFVTGPGSAQLHGLRYCFPKCFERALRRRFNTERTTADPRPRPSHRGPLGLLMLSRGDLTDVQLRQVLEAQQRGGSGRFGEWIQKLGYAREQQVVAALAAQWSCPVLKALPLCVAECAVPLGLLQRFHMAPVHFVRTTRVLHLAFIGDIEYRALLAIEQMLNCKTEACLTTSAALEVVLARLDQEAKRSDKVFDGPRLPEEMTRITSSYALKLGAEEVRMVACGEYIWVRIENRRDAANLLFSRNTTAPYREELAEPAAS